ncbi:MAG: dTDP-4-dehydrorhamnose 3,5-epimerase [Pseudomonadota bacterium]|uniref:dTDP-4-dehydrorhamnose 3,5-epimerase n=1 Tax=Thermithiobacillus tepidarius TaxID=929 RepID=UPI0004040BA5|nr:dTDP-4-dehydrorhamnose 3,5-epimerase [Thermithiobacillus tepidarius]
MKFTPTAIPDVILVQPDVFGDHRGFFMETWHARKFAEGGIDAAFVQDNHSRSAQGILRGLHYQVRQPQGKLVRVVAGEVFDVAVDLRRGSPTFGHWVGELLSADNKHQLWVPPGFAHGFYVTSDTAEVVYKCSDFYAPEHERSLRWDDPDLNIDWPLVNGQPPVLSAKDAAGALLKEAECFP